MLEIELGENMLAAVPVVVVVNLAKKNNNNTKIHNMTKYNIGFKCVCGRGLSKLLN